MAIFALAALEEEAESSAPDNDTNCHDPIARWQGGKLQGGTVLGLAWLKMVWITLDWGL